MQITGKSAGIGEGDHAEDGEIEVEGANDAGDIGNQRRRKAPPQAVIVAGRNGAEILRLRIDSSGEFVDEWPDGFFEESYREMFPVQS